ncbi:hypothetical protein NL676_036521 [Syzygium grande]|nr:hypothetical protein NL676_036521 [Syzygium grande]
MPTPPCQPTATSLYLSLSLVSLCSAKLATDKASKVLAPLSSTRSQVLGKADVRLNRIYRAQQIGRTCTTLKIQG